MRTLLSMVLLGSLCSEKVMGDEPIVLSPAAHALTQKALKDNKGTPSDVSVNLDFSKISETSHQTISKDDSQLAEEWRRCFKLLNTTLSISASYTFNHGTQTIQNVQDVARRGSLLVIKFQPEGKPALTKVVRADAVLELTENGPPPTPTE